MKGLFRSFNFRISALFLALILLTGIPIALICMQSLLDYVDETEQKLNTNLGHVMAEKFQPWVQESIDEKMIQMEIEKVAGINPRNDVYLLGGNGMIKASFLNSGTEIKRPVVETATLDRFLSGDIEYPLLGPDPLDDTLERPFSVAPIEIMGETGCYLYIILGGKQYQTTAAMFRNSYITKATLQSVALTLLLVGGLGLILFYWLTRRLRRVQTAVVAFQQGDHHYRLGDLASDDEISQLGRSYNQMADTIVQNMDELKRVDRLRRDLIANVSHDLRSPLASIQGYLETIQIKDASLTSEQRSQYLGTALTNTTKLNTLVESLFELSKLDAHQVEPHREQFSIAELVQDLVMQYRPAAEAKGVAVKADLPDRISLVHADISLIERAISNLIDNAIRHTPEGGVVSIAPADENQMVRISVADTGEGIPPEEVEHIFDRFYQSQKSTRKRRSGAGLGLAIAKRIVELHGSTLSVQTALNRGTTFMFSLPTGAPA